MKCPLWLTHYFLQVGMGLQEKGSQTGQWWLSQIDASLGEGKEYERVGSRQLAGMLVGVWYAGMKHLISLKIIHRILLSQLLEFCGLGRKSTVPKLNVSCELLKNCDRTYGSICFVTGKFKHTILAVVTN